MKASHRWLREVLAPFAITRVALLIIGHLALLWPVNALYPSEAIRARQWQFSPIHALDMWARFDAGWFMSIVYEGYWWGRDLNVDFSNVAFFPLYPALVRVLLMGVPAPLDTPELRPQWFALAGVIVANAMLLGALSLWRQLLTRLNTDAVARTRATWLLLASPFGFFFSAAYSESTFACMLLAALLAALDGRWRMAGVFGALAALARPPGILILLPLLACAVAPVSWRPRALIARLGATLPRWLPLLLIPLAWLAFLVYLYPRTGHPLSPYTAHNAWEEYYTPPWFTLLGLFSTRYELEFIDRAVLIATLLGGGLLLRGRDTRRRLLGATALLIAIAPLWSGTLVSIGRYCLSAFIALIGFIPALPRNALFALAMAVCAIAQAALFVAWVRFYNVM